nr:helicase [Tanacetum cinerariifolium]
MFDETARSVVKCSTGLIVASEEHVYFPQLTQSVVLEEVLDESGSSGTLAAAGDLNTGVFMPLTTTPSVTTPSKPGEHKKPRSNERHDSDGEESFVADSKTKGSDVGCSSEAGKREGPNIQSHCVAKYEFGISSIIHGRKRATNLKGKAIVDAPNMEPPETGCKSKGAASISKRLTANLKGKTIANPNNAATTKTGWTTTCNVLFKKQTRSLIRREKNYKNTRKPAALASSGFEVSYHSLGAPSYLCPNCNATIWYEEINNKGNKDQDPTFLLCCQQGKVLLSRFKDTPEPLNGLLDYNQLATSVFRDLIRVYNGMFCFTSFRARIDHSINRGMGHYTFRINGQNSHMIRSLLPTEGTQPSEEGVDGTIVGGLIRMLDANSTIAKAFWMARDWCHVDATTNVELRLLSERTRSKQYNALTVAEVAALITNDFGDGEPIRDIVVCKKGSLPKRISELHPSYMALQYPLLFPHGEDGYHEKIPYHTNKGKRKTTRDYVTMKEYYAYVIQYRNDWWTTLHRGGRCKAATEIDYIISAELPSPTADPTGYKAVSNYMLHGPCGKGNRAATCNVEGKCSKHFPKPSYAETVIDQEGYPIYRKRDDKAHINVEWCNRSKAIKYVFKYLNKGPNRATIVIQENVQQGQGTTEQKVTVVDEIKNYLNYHYLAPCEAVWRIVSFDIHHSYPSVMKLNFHLQNQQPVTLHDTDCLPALLQKEGIDGYREDVFIQDNHLKAKIRTEDYTCCRFFRYCFAAPARRHDCSQQIVEETYPNFIQRQKDDAYLRERAILTPRNDDADAINGYMFDKLAG